MMKKTLTVAARSVLLILMLVAVATPTFAKKYTGRVGGKYPIVAYLNFTERGVTGKYAYRSTLQKYGDKPSSWLTIRSYRVIPGGAATAIYLCEVRDSKGKFIETWEITHGSMAISPGRRVAVTDVEIILKNGKRYSLYLQ